VCRDRRTPSLRRPPQYPRRVRWADRPRLLMRPAQRTLQGLSFELSYQCPSMSNSVQVSLHLINTASPHLSEPPRAPLTPGLILTPVLLCDRSINDCTGAHAPGLISSPPATSGAVRTGTTSVAPLSS